MKASVLIIVAAIGIIATLLAGTFAYQQVYNQKCIDGGDRVPDFFNVLE